MIEERLVSLAIALAIGLLIGVERGWQKREAAEGTRIAGVRTYGLIALFGALAGMLAQALDSALILGFALLATAGGLIAGQLSPARRPQDAGITSLVAGLVTAALGAATVLGYAIEAGAVAVIMIVLLGTKPQLHRWVRAIEAKELRAAVTLLLISVVALPLLPDRGYGPWESLNPYAIWWMVVLISAISFAGYLAMKLAGAAKGALLTGLFAGLASSTALTLHFSRLARARPAMMPVLAPGILLACATMFPRMLAVASIVYWPIFQTLAFPAAVMAIVAFTAAGLLYRRSRKSAPEAPSDLRNPLQLGSALGFGALLAVIMLAARGLESQFAGTGILALAGVSGLSDVDAITLTLADMSGAEITRLLAAQGIVVAAAANSLVKGAMALIIGGRGLGLRVLPPLGIAAAAGLATVWALAETGA